MIWNVLVAFHWTLGEKTLREKYDEPAKLCDLDQCCLEDRELIVLLKLWWIMLKKMKKMWSNKMFLHKFISNIFFLFVIQEENRIWPLRYNCKSPIFLLTQYIDCRCFINCSYISTQAAPKNKYKRNFSTAENWIFASKKEKVLHDYIYSIICQICAMKSNISQLISFLYQPEARTYK